MNFKELKAIVSTDTMLLAALPVLGYVFALAFEYGYAVSFGYPVSLVVIDLRMILTSLALGVLYIYGFAWILDKYVNEVNSESLLGKFLKVSFPIFVLIAVVLFGSGFHPKVLWPCFFFGVSMMALNVIFLCFGSIKHGVKGAIENLEKEFSAPISTKNERLLSKIFNESLSVFIVLLLIFGGGRVYAQIKMQYSSFVIGSQHYVIAAIYGDSVVGVALSEGLLEEKFAIISKDDESMKNLVNISLKHKDVESAKP